MLKTTRLLSKSQLGQETGTANIGLSYYPQRENTINVKALKHLFIYKGNNNVIMLLTGLLRLSSFQGRSDEYLEPLRI